MIALIHRIIKRFPAYERPVQIALLVAALLLVGGVVALVNAPRDARLPILAGLGSLLFVMQAGVLWAERGMVRPFTAAQRAYLNEDFAAAITTLEAERAAGRAGVRTLTLLGNAYRQQGQLEASRTVLYEALHKAPADHFPLYGIGRTLLTMGDASEAYAALAKAAAHGAPAAVWIDAAEAAWYAGDTAAARDALAQADARDAFAQADAPRAWLARWLRWKLDGGEPPAPDTAAAAYWQAQHARFAHTAYGDALNDMISQAGFGER
jgi:tetratricopeptide (TPR) repeat protein